MNRIKAIAKTTGVTRQGLTILWMGVVVTMAALALSAKAALSEGHVIKSHGISTFGELKYPAGFTHLDYVNPSAPKGGEISMGVTGGFDSMHPYSVKGRAGALSSVFFESLLTGTADEIGSVYGLLAESLEYPKDRSWVVFNLHPEAKFSDGSPVTTEDVMFSYEILLEKGLVSFRTQLQKQIESVEILSPHKIKYTFKTGIPTRDLPSDIGTLPVFSKAGYEAAGWEFDSDSLVPLIGSGPYVLDSLDVGRRIVYKRNPNYWGVNQPLMKGTSNFDRIRIEYYGDGSAACEGFKGGDYTFRSENSSKQWATEYDFPAIEKGFIKKEEIAHGNKSPGQSFVFNLRREKFQDKRVREALGLAFNFEWSNETLFYGIYQRTSSFWGNSYLEAQGMPSAAELAILEPLADILPEGVLDQEVFSYPVANSSQNADRRMLRKASKLLEDAGWIVGDDGMRRNAAGETLTVELLNDSQAFDRVLNPYVENLRRIGVDATHTRVDNAESNEREGPPNYDFDVITWFTQTGYIPGSELRQWYGSETADSSTFNKMGLRSPAIDALIDVVLAAETQAELNVAVSALDRVMRWEKFAVPEWFKGAHTVAFYDMYDRPENLPPYSLGQMDFWWYNAENAEKLKQAGAL